jgi:hypothetical protein
LPKSFSFATSISNFYNKRLKLFFVAYFYTMAVKRKPRKQAHTKGGLKQSQRQSVVVNVHVPKAAARRRRRTAGGATQKPSANSYVVVQPSLAVSNPIPQMYSPTQQADTSFPTSAPTTAAPPPVVTPAATHAPTPPAATPERVFTRPADVPLSAIPRQRIAIGDYYDDSLSDILSLDGSTLSVRNLSAQDLLSARAPHDDNFVPEQRTRSNTPDYIPDRSFDNGTRIESGCYGDDEAGFRVNNPMLNEILSTHTKPRKPRSDKGLPRGPYRQKNAAPDDDESEVFSHRFMEKVLSK